MAGERPEIRALTGIRGFAAAWVVLFHLEWYGLYEAFPSLAAIRPFGRMGFLGVDLFFVLSGFILTWNYAEALADWRPREHARFEMVRLARIWPVHVATLAFMAAFVAAEKLLQRGGPWLGARFDPAVLPQHVLLVHAWFPGRPTWNVPSWTISAEWAAYLAFPLFCPFVARLRSALVALVGAAALCVATIYALRALGFGESLSTDNPGGLVRIAGEFGAGCLLCRVFQISGRRAESWSLLTFPALAALAAVLWLGVADPWAVPAFGALVLALAADRGVVARLLGTRWSLFWGCASYSLYMTHWMVLGLLTLWMSRFDLERRATTGERVLWLAAALAAVAAAAILTWRYVEEPGRRVLRRLTSAGARSPSPAR